MQAWAAGLCGGNLGGKSDIFYNLFPVAKAF
jgi:hypothetical protein